MRSYLDTLEYILKYGTNRDDRTGTGTRGVFGVQTRYDLRKGFPGMTTKKLAWKAVVSELLWFLEGSGDERRLCEIRHGSVDADKKTIWTANAEAGYWKHKAKFPGDLGRVYGVQWRHWQTFHSLAHDEGNDDVSTGKLKETDQIANLIDGIKNDPFDRRHLLTAWNPGELDQMALPPCHLLAQFYVAPLSLEEREEIFTKKYPTVPTTGGGYINKESLFAAYNIPTNALSCQMYQRSCDMFLGVPFNIASYSLLTHMIAQVCGLAVGEFIHTLGDAHIYNNHFDQVEEQLQRTPLELPTLQMNTEIMDIDNFTMEDFELLNYNPHEAIKAPMAV